MWFEPDPARATSLANLGLLGRMCAQPTAIEAHSQAPSFYRLRACVYKQLGLLPLDGNIEPDQSEPWMWVICAGRPTEGLIALNCAQAAGFPPGVYLGPSVLRAGIVVISELPINRDTLLVRLLGGRDKVFEQAMREIQELPMDAPERQRTLPMLRRYYMDTRTEERPEEEEEDGRIMMDFFEELRAEGHSLGLEQGLIAAFAARFGPMPADLRALIHKRKDKRVLHKCFELIAVASAAEAFAGLRARLNAPTPRRVRGHVAHPQGAR
jgi:hypothetical protein